MKIGVSQIGRGVTKLNLMMKPLSASTGLTEIYFTEQS